MLLLYVSAPFGAFRPFVAGSYRPTAPFVTPTAAYGLLLNLAGIESRRFDPDLVATDTATDLPPCKIALGMLREPHQASMFLQLHNYPVGNTGKDHAAATWGAKYNIQPITRELLVDLEAVIGLRGNQDLEQAVRHGLEHGLTTPRQDGAPRYGVPFFGDNSFLVDIIEELPSGQCPDPRARWYCPIDRLPSHEGPRPGTCRMPLWINRNDITLSRSQLFAPVGPSQHAPDEAWVLISPS